MHSAFNSKFNFTNRACCESGFCGYVNWKHWNSERHRSTDSRTTDGSTEQWRWHLVATNYTQPPTLVRTAGRLRLDFAWTNLTCLVWTLSCIYMFPICGQERCWRICPRPWTFDHYGRGFETQTTHERVLFFDLRKQNTPAKMNTAGVQR
jgi:hypothetical protein